MPSIGNLGSDFPNLEVDTQVRSLAGRAAPRGCARARARAGTAGPFLPRRTLKPERLLVARRGAPRAPRQCFPPPH